MSHWQSGKLNLVCDIDVLVRALINIAPEWAEHIKVDKTGNITLNMRSDWEETYHNQKQKGFSVVIPMNCPGVRNADIGFKQNSDGSWAITSDGGADQLRNPEGQVSQEVANMRARAIAAMNGLQVVKDADVGDEHVIHILCPEGIEVQF